MAIDIARMKDLQMEFKDGYAQTEVLEGVYPLVRCYQCVLKAGHTVKPETFGDKIQVFSFVQGSGYICGEKEAYNLKELSFYIPNFDKETFTIYAAEDMIIALWVVDMRESDKIAYEDTHMVLPSFKKFSELEPYDQSCKGPHTKSWTVISDGNLARVLMGIVRAEGEGTKERGHGEVAQWNYALPGSDFTFTVEDESVHHLEHEFSYVKAGLDHSLVAEPGKTVFYIWFEHWVEERKIVPQYYETN